MHSQLNPYTFSIEPKHTFIWTPEALWNEPGFFFKNWEKKTKNPGLKN